MPSVAAYALALLTAALGPLASTAADATRSNLVGAWMTVSGTVISVDRRHHLFSLRHGPLETAPAGTVTCLLANVQTLERLRPGDHIDAFAQTDRHPWLLRDPRILWHLRGRPLIASLPRSLGERQFRRVGKS